MLKTCGSPGYIAPEILMQNQEKNDFKIETTSDIFSLGIIFYILLTGYSPWKNPEDHEGVLKQNLKCDIDCGLQNRYLRNYDHPTRSLLEQLIMKDPSKRISVKNALKAFKELNQSTNK